MLIGISYQNFMQHYAAQRFDAAAIFRWREKCTIRDDDAGAHRLGYSFSQRWIPITPSTLFWKEMLFIREMNCAEVRQLIFSEWEGWLCLSKDFYGRICIQIFKKGSLLMRLEMQCPGRECHCCFPKSDISLPRRRQTLET